MTLLMMAAAKGLLKDSFRNYLILIKNLREVTMIKQTHFIQLLGLLIAITTSFNVLNAQQRTELPEERTLFSRTFRNADNSFTAEISAAPMNYVDSDGKFQPINRDIVPSDTEFDFEVTRGLYHAYFKSDLQSDYPVVFESKDGANLRMKLTAMAYLDINSKNYSILQNIQSAKPKITRNEIAFQNVFDNIDLKYFYGDTRLKEEIWVHEDARNSLPAPSNFGISNHNAYLVFIMQLDLDGAPMAYAKGRKVRNHVFEGYDPINFRNIKKEIKFFLPVDWAFRDEDRRSEEGLHEDRMLKINRRLIHTPQGHFLLAGVKLQDLQSMPSGTVVFDPQVWVSQPDTAGYDTWLNYLHLSIFERRDYNYGIRDRIEVLRSYYSNYHRYRTLIQFDLSALPANAGILSATFEVNCAQVFPLNQYPIVVDLHKMLVSWDEGNQSGSYGDASWNERKPGTSWGTPGGQSGVDYDATVVASFTANSSAILNQWLDWDVTDLVINWEADPSSNYGMMMKISDEHLTVYKFFRFHSSDSSSDTLRPKLSVTYADEGSEVVYYIRDASGQVIATYKK